jgi:hypothetical protein
MICFEKGGYHMRRLNKGQVLVLFVMTLVLLIGIAALGIDVG